jgi:hypothetical protein
VTDFEMPTGPFFGIAVVPLLTTATLDHLPALYPQGCFEAWWFRPNIVVATAAEGGGFIENEWVGHTASTGDKVGLPSPNPAPVA